MIKTIYLLAKLILTPDERGELTFRELAESIPETPPELPPSDLGFAVGKILFTFIALIALLLVTFWFLKKLIQSRLEKGGSNSAIHLLERRMISPKTMLYLVEIEGKKIVLAESHLEIRKVDTLSEESSS